MLDRWQRHYGSDTAAAIARSSLEEPETAINPATWQLTGVAPLGVTSFELRATGIMPASRFSSNGIYQVIESVNVLAAPGITSSGSAAASQGTPFTFTVSGTRSPSFF